MDITYKMMVLVKWLNRFAIKAVRLALNLEMLVNANLVIQDFI